MVDNPAEKSEVAQQVGWWAGHWVTRLQALVQELQDNNVDAELRIEAGPPLPEEAVAKIAAMEVHLVGPPLTPTLVTLTITIKAPTIGAHL